jgi:hypothetical protein
MLAIPPGSVCPTMGKWLLRDKWPQNKNRNLNHPSPNLESLADSQYEIRKKDEYFDVKE